MKTKILTLSLALVLFSCQSNSNKAKTTQTETEQTTSQKATGDTSEVCLDWDGTYQGFLPSASGTGILVTLNLYNDKTFQKVDFYLEGENSCFEEKGTFSFSEDGEKIIIGTGEHKKLYAVGENKLILLDKDGKKSTSELANMYVLRKQSDESPKFKEQYVRGLLTFGHEVSSFQPIGSTKVYWINDKSGKLNSQYKELTKEIKTAYTPVLAELMLEYKGKATEGFAEGYDGLVETLKIKLVEPLTYESYTKKSIAVR